MPSIAISNKILLLHQIISFVVECCGVFNDLHIALIILKCSDQQLISQAVYVE
jgi:hypothetical protein